MYLAEIFKQNSNILKQKSLNSSQRAFIYLKKKSVIEHYSLFINRKYTVILKGKMNIPSRRQLNDISYKQYYTEPDGPPPQKKTPKTVTNA